MRRLTVWRVVYRLFWFAQYAAFVGAALLGAVQKAGKPEDWNPFWGSIVRFGQAYLWLVPLLGVLGLVGKLVCDYIGPPWVWAVVQKIVDKFAEKAFEPVPGAAAHDYRVTLFRHTWALERPWRGKRRPGERWRWPWSGWLVPVVRSGHTTQNTNAIFLAPDDAYNAEGVVGQTWANRKVVQTRELPDLNVDSSDSNIREYATQTFVAEEWVRQRLRERKPFPLTLCGIPVEVGGRVWGVIVLDSRHSQAIKDKAHSYKTYQELVPAVLAELLKHRAVS